MAQILNPEFSPLRSGPTCGNICFDSFHFFWFVSPACLEPKGRTVPKKSNLHSETVAKADWPDGHLYLCGLERFE